MHTLEIKLRQHTPLIHFQPDQEGATLRASEVKPRLDRFVITQIGSGKYNEGLKKIIGADKEYSKENKWLIGNGDKYGLNYKMQIIPISIPECWDMEWPAGTDKYGKPKTARFPMFFGNMNTETPKKMSFCKQGLTMTLVARNNELLETIKNYISLFFVLNNFGTRQTKGFGSFLPEGTSVANTINQGYAVFERNIEGTTPLVNRDGFNKLFTDIDYFYKTIRSGINQQGIYLKSLMFFYAIEGDEYWDKRTIRHKFQHFSPNKDNDKGEKYESKNYGDNKETEARLYRDCLGLSSSQEWKKYSDTITKEFIPSHGEDSIDRFKSPILIKPIYENGCYSVYLIPSAIPAKYLNSEFIIRSRVKGKSFQMKTPNEFDTNDYVQYFCDTDIRNWVIKNLNSIKATGAGEKIQKTLISIYETLKYIQK